MARVLFAGGVLFTARFAVAFMVTVRFAVTLMVTVTGDVHGESKS